MCTCVIYIPATYLHRHRLIASSFSRVLLEEAGAVSSYEMGRPGA